MAVYTPLTPEQLSPLLIRYDLGALVRLDAIAEGIQNSNFILTTTQSRFILTLYEQRVRASDLPWFLALMAHYAKAGLPVPRPMADREGQVLHSLAERPAAILTFMEGESLTDPNVDQMRTLGMALARMHEAGTGFTLPRRNDLGTDALPVMAQRLAPHFDAFAADFAGPIAQAVRTLATLPSDLPQGPVHADFFPDNVLFSGDTVSGVIDFYFACTDALAYDLAIALMAWCFETDGSVFHADRASALRQGYENVRPLTVAERSALPALAQQAALRFTLTRLESWFNTPASALVTRKDPEAFLRRLHFVQTHPTSFA